MEDKPIETQEDEINLLDYLIVLAKTEKLYHQGDPWFCRYYSHHQSHHVTNI